MAPAELNYEIHDKEMLVIVKTIKEWRVELAFTPAPVKVYTDYKALKYFISSKKLIARQARWAELLVDFYFIILYRSGKDNLKADVLTRRDDETSSQDAVKKTSYTQTFLTANKLDPQIYSELRASSVELAPVNRAIIEHSFDLINCILQINRGVELLAALRLQAERLDDKDFSLKNGLLLYQDRLVVPDQDYLRVHLIREAHNQMLTAYPRRDKTY